MALHQSLQHKLLQKLSPQQIQLMKLLQVPTAILDERIKEDVCETLSRDHRIDASDIEVNVEDAMVTLSGNVDSRDIKRAAEMIIENLSGVDDVKNDIKVKKAGEMNHDPLLTSGSNKSSNLNSSSTSKNSTTKSSGHI